MLRVAREEVVARGRVEQRACAERDVDLVREQLVVASKPKLMLMTPGPESRACSIPWITSLTNIGPLSHSASAACG